jgi:hypothetical protein
MASLLDSIDKNVAAVTADGHSSIDPATINQIKLLGRESLFFFAKSILGFSLLDRRIHLPICQKLEQHAKYSRIVVELPRDWFKSTLVTVAYLMWRWIRNPEIRCLLVLNTFTNACGKLLMISDIVKKRTLFRVCYPEVLPDSGCTWKADKLCGRRNGSFHEGTFEAAGSGTQVTSRHYDIIIEDDTVAPEKDNLKGMIMQPTRMQIEKAIGWHRLAGPLLMHPLESQIIVVGTRWMENDLIDWILKNEPSYYYIRRAAREDKEGNPSPSGDCAWPDRFGPVVLKALQDSLGNYMFSTLFLGNPIPESAQIFRKSWIEYYDPADLPKGLVFLTLVDAAGGISDGSVAPNLSVVNTVGIDQESGRMYDVRYDAGMFNPGEHINKMFEHYRMFSSLKFLIEVNAYQKTLAWWTKQRQRETGEYFLIETVNNLRSKDERIRALQPFFSGGMILIRPDMIELETELLSYPRGQTDDIIDTLSMALPTLIELRKQKAVEERAASIWSAESLIEKIRERNSEKNEFPDHLRACIGNDSNKRRMVALMAN